MATSKMLAADAPSAEAAYRHLNAICRFSGDAANIINPQHEDLIQRGVQLYLTDFDGTRAVAGAYTVPNGPLSASLNGVIVHPKARQHGHGRAITEFVVASEFGSQVERITLMVRIDRSGQINLPALKLYTSIGFRPTGVVKTERITSDPRVSHLWPSREDDGTFRAAQLELLAEGIKRYA